MQEVYIERIKTYLDGMEGEIKLLDEWVDEINNMLPKYRRLTPREVAHMFSVFRKKGWYNVTRTCSPIQYSFL